MKYLLDVNALIALGYLHHAFHQRVAYWLASERTPELLTCSITELGFVRILAQAPGYGFTITHTQALLAQLKQSPNYSFNFLADDQDSSHLPQWVTTSKQTTDGHLANLALAHGARLATLDAKIQDAFLIL